MTRLVAIDDAAPEAYREPSDEAMQHLALLLAHRGGRALAVTVHPSRCSLCAELAEWSRALGQAECPS
jgi:hypothetical protein